MRRRMSIKQGSNTVPFTETGIERSDGQDEGHSLSLAICYVVRKIMRVSQTETMPQSVSAAIRPVIRPVSTKDWILGIGYFD